MLVPLKTDGSDAVLDDLSVEAPDSEVEEHIRKSVETLYHPCCTARMAPLSEGGVVDARLRVHGIEGLRVVDASVFPNIVAGHTVRSTVCFKALLS